MVFQESFLPHYVPCHYSSRMSLEQDIFPQTVSVIALKKTGQKTPKKEQQQHSCSIMHSFLAASQPRSLWKSQSIQMWPRPLNQDGRTELSILMSSTIHCYTLYVDRRSPLFFVSKPPQLLSLALPQPSWLGNCRASLPSSNWRRMRASYTLSFNGRPSCTTGLASTSGTSVVTSGISRGGGNAQGLSDGSGKLDVGLGVVVSKQEATVRGSLANLAMVTSCSKAGLAVLTMGATMCAEAAAKWFRPTSSTWAYHSTQEVEECRTKAASDHAIDDEVDARVHDETKVVEAS